MSLNERNDEDVIVVKCKGDVLMAGGCGRPLWGVEYFWE